MITRQQQSKDSYPTGNHTHSSSSNPFHKTKKHVGGLFPNCDEDDTVLFIHVSTSFPLEVSKW